MASTSTTPAMRSKIIETAKSFALSLKINQIHFGFLLVNAAEIRPPAIAPMKYARISKLPCGKKTIAANGKAFIPPILFASIPIATAKTEAFQVNMKIAPAPKMNENRNERKRTPMLFDTILKNVSGDAKLPLIALISFI